MTVPSRKVYCEDEPVTSYRIRSGRLSLTPLAVADADEMVGVLSGATLYTFTGGSPPSLAELRARYAGLAGGRSPDGHEEWWRGGPAWCPRAKQTKESNSGYGAARGGPGGSRRGAGRPGGGSS